MVVRGIVKKLFSNKRRDRWTVFFFSDPSNRNDRSVHIAQVCKIFSNEANMPVFRSKISCSTQLFLDRFPPIQMKAKEQNSRRISLSCNCTLNHKHVLMKVIQNNLFKTCFFPNIQEFYFVLSLKWTVTTHVQGSSQFFVSVDKDQLTLVLRELKISTKTCSSVPIPWKIWQNQENK